MKKVCLSISLLILAAQILAGCGRPDLVPQAASRPTPPLPTVVAPAGDRLYIRAGFGSDHESMTIVDSLNSDRAPDLPFGVVAPDWSALYAVEQRDGKTHVRALDPQTGRVLRETALDGAYDLPRITNDHMVGGLSPDGRWLALETTPAPEGGTWQSHLVVLDTAFARPPRRVDLAGNFSFDGLSSNGSALYLIENLPPDQPTNYRVRLYELAQGTLAPQPITDKRHNTEVMSGVRQDAIPSHDGKWLFSLYLNYGSGPFIHALNLDERFAFCIILPDDAKEDSVQQSMWSLASSPNDNLLYAVNGGLGVVAEMETQQLQVRRTARLVQPVANTGVAVAHAGGWRVGDAAVAPDGKTLFTLGEKGLLAIDLADLTLREHYLTDWTLDSVAISRDGKRLYVVSGGQGKLMQLDSSTGAVLATLSGGERPWQVLRVEPR